MATAQSGTILHHIRTLAGSHAEGRTDRQLLEDFAGSRTEAAFAALVSRHGPMVLRVCRRVLRHEQDAEDAFQATFLVLAQQTAAIRKREAVGDWLYGVAYRTAMKAKRSAARRRNHEAQMRTMSPQPVSPTWDEVQGVLDEEVQHLAAPFRAAFVLCVLDGKSGAEAAAELGCKEGTVRSRVTRARRLLQRHLARRGIQLSALLTALSIAASTSRAALLATLMQATVRFGTLVAAGEAAAGVIPSHVTALAAGVTRAMFLTQAKIATALLLAVGLMIASAGLLARQALAAGGPPAGAAKQAGSDPTPAPRAARPPADDKETISYGGRVVGPDGRPIAGAKLYLTPFWGLRERSPAITESATTSVDGRFRFAVPKATVREDRIVVTAVAANYAVTWMEVPAEGKRDDLTLQLTTDDVPINGEIVDLQGRPIAGATVRVLQISAAPKEDLGPWLEAVKAKKGLSFELEHQYFTRWTTAMSAKVTTDDAGRFRLTGIGRNRLVRVRLDGPGIASQYLHVLTRPGRPIEVTELTSEHEGNFVTTYYGASLRHVAAPSRTILGVVRDKDTKRPLAGVTIKSDKLATAPWYGRDIVQTTTDAKGRFQLAGLPKGEGNQVLVVPNSEQPYPIIRTDVPNSPGLGPVTLDIDLKRGVWIEGKVTDKATGKPLQGSVQYFALHDNAKNLHDYPGYAGERVDSSGTATRKDGSYRVVGLPGPGLLALRCWAPGLSANERDDEYGTKQVMVFTKPGPIISENYTGLARVEPPQGTARWVRDLPVDCDPGWSFTGRVLGPDDKPLPGVLSFGLVRRLEPWDAQKKMAEFTVSGLNPRRPREFLFLHQEKGLVGTAGPPKANGGSVMVRMVPGAAVRGRLVDADGRPRAGVELKLTFRTKTESFWQSYPPESIKTDMEGRFRLEALLPGYRFRLSDSTGELLLDSALRSGQTTELGDVQMTQPDG
jgi:RNA polymerase sigma factor (sigma-70 family)